MINIPLVLITSLQIAVPQGKVPHTPIAPKPAPPAVVQPAEPVPEPAPPTLPIAPAYTYGNSYAPGNCTYFIASVKNIPSNLGNANQWAYNASAQGVTVSRVPIVGSVAQNTTDSWLGHVALVIGVDGDQVLLREMNYQGFGVISERWANVSQYQYIYV